MNIEEKLNNYVSAYQKILNESMANDTPYDKLIKKLDELFAQYKITDEKARDARLATLSNLVQGVTATSQEIALRLLLESEELEAKLGQIQAQTELIKTQKALAEAEIPLRQKELELAEKRLLLAEKEAEFNAKRAELIEKQAQSEIARKAAIERETKSFDDRLRIQEATLLKDSVFGYAVGGLTPPTDMQTKMYNAIDAITP